MWVVINISSVELFHKIYMKILWLNNGDRQLQGAIPLLADPAALATVMSPNAHPLVLYFLVVVVQDLKPAK